MRFHADGVNDGVGTSPAGPLPELFDDVALAGVDRLDAVAGGHLEPFRYEVDSENPFGTERPGDPGAELPDRPEAEDRQAPALRRVGISHRLPRRGQDVGEVEESVIGRAFRNLDRAEIGVRDPQVLGLAAGDLTVELGIAEQRRPLAVLPNLRGLALGVEVLVAHEAVAAGDIEGDDHTIAGFEVRHARTDFLDDPHRLVAEHVAVIDEHAQQLVEVEIRTADRRRGDPHDGIGRFPDRRVRNRVDPNVFHTVPRQSLHSASLASRPVRPFGFTPMRAG